MTIDELEKKLADLQKEVAKKNDRTIWPTFGTSIWLVIFFTWLATQYGCDPKRRIDNIPITYGTLVKAGVIEVHENLRVTNPAITKMLGPVESK